MSLNKKSHSYNSEWDFKKSFIGLIFKENLFGYPFTINQLGHNN